MRKKQVTGYFLDEHDLIKAVKSLKEKNTEIKDVFTPFPVHGLDDAMQLKKSRIPTVGFIFGAIGAACAFYFQAWVFTNSYPLNIGGKPYYSVPTFIPVTFETTVLFASFAMVFAFLVRSKLGVGAKNKIYDERATDDHFVVLLEGDNTEELKSVLNEVGAQGVKEEDELE